MNKEGYTLHALLSGIEADPDDRAIRSVALDLYTLGL